MPRIVSFKTAQGSRYFLEGTRTQRTKSLHKNHPTDDVGKKPWSNRTVYVAEAVAIHAGLLTQPSAPPVQILENGACMYFIAWNFQANKWGISPSDREGFTYEEQPRIGLSPLELWFTNKTNSFSKWHIGNVITEINEE